MKNATPTVRHLRFATAGQRALTLLLVLVFIALALAARSGRYDRQVNRLAHGLEAGYARVVAFVHDTFRRH